MSAMNEFILRSSLFMMFFLCFAYYLFRHIEKVKKLHGTPKDTQNIISVLKHFFMPNRD